jgi:P4 family phage/plasmid primase-like protien
MTEETVLNLSLLRMIHPPSTSCLFSICKFDPLRRHTFVSSAEEAINVLEEYDTPDTQGVFFGLGNLSKLPARGRGKKSDVSRICMLWLDIDYLDFEPLRSAAKKTDKETAWRNASEEARKQAAAAAKVSLDSVRFQPSALVSSGRGLHAYWKLEEPYEGNDLPEAESLMKALSRAVGGDNTSDVSRVLRIPGSTHRKDPSEPLRCKVLWVDEGRVYGREELCRSLLKGIEGNGGGTSQHLIGEDRQSGDVDDLDIDDIVDREPSVRKAFLAQASADQMKIWNEGSPGKPDRSQTAFLLGCIGKEMSLFSCRNDIYALWLGCPITSEWLLEKTAAAVWYVDHHAEQGKCWLEGSWSKLERAAGQAAGQVDEEKGGEVPLPERWQEGTDVGNSQRFARIYCDSLCWCRERDWMRWTGRIWKPISEPSVILRAEAVGQQLHAEATAAGDDDSRKFWRGCATRSQSRGALVAMEFLARGKLDVGDDPFQGNHLENLLVVKNGVLDLRTGDLLPHDPLRYPTVESPVEFDPDATSPLFDKFFREVMPDPETRSFLLRLLGYGLCGLNIEHKLPILWGGGRNGKTTLIHVLSQIVGEYYYQVGSDTFLEKQHEGIRCDLAALSGRRFAVAEETNIGKRLDESLVKQYTGGEKIQARFLRKDPFLLEPRGLLIMATNHKPRIFGQDRAIWERICLIPFQQQFLEGAPGTDPRLKYKLVGESAGILNYLIQGAMEYHSVGLQIPEKLRWETERYKTEEDPLCFFLEERCHLAKDAKVPAKELWTSYTSYSYSSGERQKQLGKKAFYSRIEGKDGVVKRRDNKGLVFHGIGLASA